MTDSAVLHPEPHDARPVLTLVDGARSLDELTDEELGSRIVGAAGRLASATCAWLLLVARFDAREGCARFGLPSTARWLSYHCGIAHRTAVEHVRVARALMDFPELAAEMAAGRLSYSQVRAISRVPGDGSEHRVVHDLIEFAEHATTGQLETMVRGLRTVADSEPLRSTDDPRREEYVRHAWTSGSQWRLNARLDPERGAVVSSALEVLARAEECTVADALVRLAEIALVVLNDSGTAPRPLRGDELAAVVIHLDGASVPATNRPAADAPRSAERAAASTPRPYARIAEGPGLPDAVVRRLLCSARVRTAVHDQQGNVRDLGRSHRLVSRRQFSALLLRDHGECAYPGCTSTQKLQAHHIVHWIDGGRTDLGNLLLLCQAHHLAHHDGDFHVARQPDGSVCFLRRDGRDLARVDPATLVDPADDRQAVGAAGAAAVAATAATTRWTGERMDRQWAISVLAQRRVS